MTDFCENLTRRLLAVTLVIALLSYLWSINQEKSPSMEEMYHTKHTPQSCDFSKLKVPPSIQGKSKQERYEGMKKVYDQALFVNRPESNNLGGAGILAEFVGIQGSNDQVPPPEKLGMRIISPVTDDFYNRTHVAHMIDHTISLLSCVSVSESGYKIKQEYQSHSDKIMAVLIPKGSVFENKELNQFQNLATQNDFWFWISPRGKQEITIDGYCMNSGKGGPNCASQATPLVSTVNANNQREFWKAMNQKGIH